MKSVRSGVRIFIPNKHTTGKNADLAIYIIHPLQVAEILADMRMDHQSLMAAMLHDVIEDTGIAKDALQAQFGEAVAELVDGVSKAYPHQLRDSRRSPVQKTFKK